MAAPDSDQQSIAQPGRTEAPQVEPPPLAQQAELAEPGTYVEAGAQAQASRPGQADPHGQPLPQARPVPPQQSIPGQPVAEAQAYQPGHPHQPPQALPPGLVAARPILVRAGATPQTVYARDDAPEREDVATIAVRNLPPWLVSAAFHMVLMIALGLLLVPNLVRQQIELQTIWAEKLGDQLEFDSPFAGTDKDMVEEPILTPPGLPVEDPFAAPPEVNIVPDGVHSTSQIDAPQIGFALRGRQQGFKRALLGAYGGNATTQAAVEDGLAWLARNQHRDGSWSLTGPYSNAAGNENKPAATAMALLAFQGDGNTHKRGQYADNVTRGWNWLFKEQDADGSFFHEGPFNHRFYTQGLCTIALCELYGMTKDEKLRERAERALQYCLRSQSPEGGWRYSPGRDSDVSVTGWVVMALQSARMAYLTVPEDNLRRVERFLDRVAVEDGILYPYQDGDEPSLAMTAEALLCRQYLGWPRDDERLVAGVDLITQPENLINYHQDRNVYYWYYATQVAHHMEGEHWKRWNAVMRQEVPKQQVKTGREAGSWDPLRARSAEDPDHWVQSRDEWEAHGGRLYVTCLSIYMLEVYYRHLPIYSKVYTYMHNFQR